jgi:hypothetical protein
LFRAGEIVSEHKVHYAGISSITWCDQAATPRSNSNSSSSSSSKGSLFSPQHSMQPHQRYKRLFVPPVMDPHQPSSTEPLPDPYEICMEAAGPASWPAERPGLSLLAAADVRGRVSLWLQGQVQVAELTAAVMPRASLAGDAAEDDGLQEEQEEERYRLLHVSRAHTYLLCFCRLGWLLWPQFAYGELTGDAAEKGGLQKSKKSASACCM